MCKPDLQTAKDLWEENKALRTELADTKRTLEMAHDELAHTIWAAAQIAPEQSIQDGVAGVTHFLAPVVAEIERLRALTTPVPCNERLPGVLEQGNLYLVWSVDFLPGVDRWDMCRWDGPRGWAHSNDSITHWLPLPKTPNDGPQGQARRHHRQASRIKK